MCTHIIHTTIGAGGTRRRGGPAWRSAGRGAGGAATFASQSLTLLGLVFGPPHLDSTISLSHEAYAVRLCAHRVNRRARRRHQQRLLDGKWWAGVDGSQGRRGDSPGRMRALAYLAYLYIVLHARHQATSGVSMRTRPRAAPRRRSSGRRVGGDESVNQSLLCI